MITNEAPDTSYTYKMIAAAATPTITFTSAKNKPSSFSILDLTFSRFSIFIQKLELAQQVLINARKSNDSITIKFGSSLASTLNEEVQKTIALIKQAVARCTSMANSIDLSSEPEMNVAKKKTFENRECNFHLRNKQDVEDVISALKRGENILTLQFLSETTSDQPEFMQLPELEKAFSTVPITYTPTRKIQ